MVQMTRKPHPKRPVPQKKRKADASESGSESGDDFSASSEEDLSGSADDESSEYEKPKKKPPAKKASPKKKSPTKKTPTKKTPTKKTPTKKSPVKKKAKKESSEEESESKSASDSEESSPKKKKKETPTKRKKEEDDDAGGPKKKRKKGEKEEEQEGWWETVDDSWKKGSKANWKWRTLEHNGVCFPPPYEPHGVKMLYDGKKITLTPDQEEAATFWARYMETEHVKKPQFSKNFFEGFKKLMGKGSEIKEFSKCDFTPILEHLKKEKEARKNRTKEEKEKEKKEKAKMKEKYGYALIDGRKEALGNYMVEPPGLFLGRGDHPKAGLLKTRTHPKDVTLNLSENAKVPLTADGQKYGSVVHNHEVAWVAFWRPNISDSPKYVLFAATSSLRGQSDQNKFDKAQLLGKNIDKIRKTYTAELKDSEESIKQRATALWIIDHLALRVGGDKGDDEADTVGCCSLRVEHMKLHDDNMVEFDFLGKDSMRYQNTVKVDAQVYKNLKSFLKGKKKDEDIFDTLNPSRLNAHLKSLMKGLTAKVFRTYNASVCMQKQLDKWDIKKNKNATAEEKLLFFNASSVEVAILCNHKRTVSTSFSDQMGKLDQLIEDTKQEIKWIQEHRKRLKAGKAAKTITKENKDGEKEEVKLPSSVESCDKRIEVLEGKIKKTEVKKSDKDQQKEISTSTSKVNYIDPRISITWCKKVDLDVSKVFPKTLRDKFGWALAFCQKKPDFRF